MQKIPADLKKAFATHRAAKVEWDSLTSIGQRDFISWIESAKQEETRTRRIEVTCSKLASGKRRPCCYAVVPMSLYKVLGKNPKAKATWKNLTPMERRDFSDWIHSAKDSKTHTLRIQKASAMLVAGKRHP